MQNAPYLPDNSNTPGQHAAVLIGRAAATPAPVLLVGESGVGKAHLAKWIHAHSAAADGPFVVVDCQSIGGALSEAEIFGDGKSQPGKCAEAVGGTLFLDEIGELPVLTQLRLSEQLRSTGDSGSESTGQPRIIAATKQPVDQLDARVAETLSNISIDVPPLRSRREEIPAIANHILGEICSRKDLGEMSFEPEALELLASRNWPENLRELRETIEQAVGTSGRKTIGRDHISQTDGRPPVPELAEVAPATAGDRITIEELETDHIRRILASSKSLTEAAKTLGIDTSTLFRKRRRLGL